MGLLFVLACLWAGLCASASQNNTFPSPAGVTSRSQSSIEDPFDAGAEPLDDHDQDALQQHVSQHELEELADRMQVDHNVTSAEAYESRRLQSGGIDRFVVYYELTCFYKAWTVLEGRIRSTERNNGGRTRFDFYRVLPKTATWYWKTGAGRRLHSSAWGMAFNRVNSRGDTFALCTQWSRPMLVWMDGCVLCAEPAKGMSAGELFDSRRNTLLQPRSVLPFISATADRGVQSSAYSDALARIMRGDGFQPINDRYHQGLVSFSQSAFGARFPGGRHGYRCTQEDKGWYFYNVGNDVWRCRDENSNLDGRIWAECTTTADGGSLGSVAGFPKCAARDCKRSCGWQRYRAGICTWQDFSCEMCTCPDFGYLDYPCDGVVRYNPPCTDCYASRPREDGVDEEGGVSPLPVSTFEPGLYQAVKNILGQQSLMQWYAYRPVPGFYHRYEDEQDQPQFNELKGIHHAPCQGTWGWNTVLRKEQPFFPMCDPPPEVGTLTPYPLRGQNTYTWRCAPGMYAPSVTSQPVPQPPPIPQKFMPAAFDGPASLRAWRDPKRCLEGVFSTSSNLTAVSLGLTDYLFFKVCHFQAVYLKTVTPASILPNPEAAMEGLKQLAVWRSWDQGFDRGKLVFTKMRYSNGLDGACGKGNEWSVVIRATVAKTNLGYIEQAVKTGECTYELIVAEPEMATADMTWVAVPTPVPTPFPRQDPVPPRTAPADAWGPEEWRSVALSGTQACIRSLSVSFQSNDGPVTGKLTVCPFDRVSVRFDARPSVEVATGWFDGWTMTPSSYHTMLFIGGDVCDVGGEYFRTHVRYVCDSSLPSDSWVVDGSPAATFIEGVCGINVVLRTRKWCYGTQLSSSHQRPYVTVPSTTRSLGLSAPSPRSQLPPQPSFTMPLPENSKLKELLRLGQHASSLAYYQPDFAETPMSLASYRPLSSCVAGLPYNSTHGAGHQPFHFPYTAQASEERVSYASLVQERYALESHLHAGMPTPSARPEAADATLTFVDLSLTSQWAQGDREAEARWRDLQQQLAQVRREVAAKADTLYSSAATEQADHDARVLKAKAAGPAPAVGLPTISLDQHGFPTGLFSTQAEALLHWRSHLVLSGAMSMEMVEDRLWESVEHYNRQLHDEADRGHYHGATNTRPRELQEVLSSRVKPSASSTASASFTPRTSASRTPSSTPSRSSTPSVSPSDHPRANPLDSSARNAGPGPILQYFNGGDISNATELRFNLAGYLWILRLYDKVTRVKYPSNDPGVDEMGFFSGWNLLGSQPSEQVYDSMRFEMGDLCGIGGRRYRMDVKFVCGREAEIDYFIPVVPSAPCSVALSAASSTFCGIDWRVGQEAAPQIIAGPALYRGPQVWQEGLKGKVFKFTLNIPGESQIVTTWEYTVRPFESVSRRVPDRSTAVDIVLGWWDRWDLAVALQDSTGMRKRAYRPRGNYRMGSPCPANPATPMTASVRYLCPLGVSTLQRLPDGHLFSAIFTSQCSVSFVIVTSGVCGGLPWEGQEGSAQVTRINSPAAYYGPNVLETLRFMCLTYSGAIEPVSFALSDPMLVSPQLGNAGVDDITDVKTYLVCPFGEVRVYPGRDNVQGPYWVAGMFQQWNTLFHGDVSLYATWNYTSGAWCDLGETYHRVTVKPTCEVTGLDRVLSVQSLGPCHVQIVYATPRWCGLNTEIGKESAVVTTERTCPVVGNKEGLQWQGEPPQCQVASIPGAHEVFPSPVLRNGELGTYPPWFFGTDTDDDGRGMWSWEYRIPGYNTSDALPWPTPAEKSIARDGILAAVMPVLVYRGHRFKWYYDKDNSDKGQGKIFMVTRPEENPPFLPNVTLRFRLLTHSFNDRVPENTRTYMQFATMPVEVTPPSSAKGAALWQAYHKSPTDHWYGSTYALYQRNPEAPVVINFVQYEWRFKFYMRFDSSDGRSLWDTLAFDPQDGSVPPSMLNREEYHIRRAIASVEYSWLYKWCPAGTYQVGYACVQCPQDIDLIEQVMGSTGWSGTYNTEPYAAEDIKARDPNSMTKVIGPDGICRPKKCQECQSVEAATGACVTKPGFCFIANKCYRSGESKGAEGNDMCSRCLASVRNDMWLQAIAGPCDDGDTCTFFDGCLGSGKCAGKPDDCLRDLTNPIYNCEVCGDNKCDIRSDFPGCSYKYSNGSKICGCSIGGSCYAHGQTHPNNTCQVCDVTRDATAWVNTPPKICDDGNSCTHTDICINGRCTGTSYSCPLTEGTGLMTCVESSVCDGKGSCNTKYRGKDYMCRPKQDACMAESFCSGQFGYCPLSASTVPELFRGRSELALYAVRHAAGALSAPSTCAQAGNLSTVARAADVLPFVENGVAFPECLAVIASQWRIACGPMQLMAGTEVITSSATQCGAGNVTRWGQPTPFMDGITPSSRVPLSATLGVDRFGTPLPMPDGTMFRILVRGTNFQEGSLDACDNSMIYIVDRTPPSPGRATIAISTPSQPYSNVNVYTATSSSPLLMSWGGWSEHTPGSTWGNLEAVKYRYRIWSSVAIPLANDGDDSILPLPGSFTLYNETWISTGLGGSDVFPPSFTNALTLLTGRWYRVEVEGYNKAGLGSKAFSNSVLYDGTPPELVYSKPKDGGDTSSTSSPLFLDWEGMFKDRESGIDHFEVAFSKLPVSGGRDAAIAFQNAEVVAVVPGGPSASNITIPYTGWELGVRLYGIVVAYNRAGARTYSFSSTGVTYDNSPLRDLAFVLPPKIVRRQGGRDVWEYRSPHTAINMRYSYTPGITTFRSVTVWVGRAFRANDIAGPITYTGAAYDRSFIIPLVNTSHEQRVRVCIAVTNTAGLTSEVCMGSDTIVLDATRPVVGAVTHRPTPTSSSARDVSVQYHTGTQISFSYVPCFDDIAGIVNHEVLVTSNGAFTQYGGISSVDEARAVIAVPWTALDQSTQARNGGIITNTDITLTQLSVTLGWSYVIHVRCTNGAGFVSDTSTAPTPVVMDNSPPTVVALGLGTDPLNPGTATANANRIDAVWRAVDVHSGISRSEWAFGACGNVTGAVTGGFRPAPPPDATGGTRASLPDVQLSGGQTYCLTVRVFNRANLPVMRTSDPVMVDVTPPIAGPAPIMDGSAYAGQPDVDVDWWSSLQTVGAEWRQAFADPETSLRYSWCAGFTQGACDVSPLISVGVEMRGTAAVPMSLQGRTVFATVVATNAAGLSFNRSSDGCTYDALTPTGASVTLLDAREVGGPVPTWARADLLSISVTQAYASTRFLGPQLGSAAPSGGSVPVRVQVRGFSGTLAPLESYGLGFASPGGTLEGSAATLLPVQSYGAASHMVAPTRIGTGDLTTLGLVDGGLYQPVVTATSAAQVTGEVVDTRGFVWDASPPLMFTAGVTYTTLASRPAVWNSTTSLRVCVSRAADPHSGIAFGWLRVRGCGVGGTCGYLTVAARSADEHSVPLLALSLIPPGHAYGSGPVCDTVSLNPPLPQAMDLQVEVVQVNGVGLTTSVLATSSLRVDATPPVFPGGLFVVAQLLPETADQFESVQLKLRFQWPKDEDDELCCTYRVAVGTTAGGDEYGATLITPGSNNVMSSTGGQYVMWDIFLVKPPTAAVYTVTLVATNTAGLTSNLTASSVLQHTKVSGNRLTWPSPVHILPGESDDSVLLSRVGMNNQATVIGTRDALTVAWSLLSPEVSAANLNDSIGDRALSSDISGFQVELRVNGNLRASPWVGFRRREVFRGLSLLHGDRIEATLRVCSNNVYSTVQDGCATYVARATVDLQTVALSSVALLSSRATATNAQVITALASSASELTFAWQGVSATEIVTQNLTVEVGLGWSAGAADAVPLAPVVADRVVTVGALSRWTMTGISLPALSPGVAVRPIFAVVRCADLAGNIVSVPSPRILLVSTGPSPVGFRAWNTAFSANRGVTSDNRTFAASWTLPGGGSNVSTLLLANNSIVPSGLERYEVLLATSPARSTPPGQPDPVILVNVTLPPTARTATIRPNSTFGIPSGTVVYMLVEAVSRVGLRTLVSSEGVLVDNTTPVGLALVHQRLIGSVNAFAASWRFSSVASGADLTYNVSLCGTFNCSRVLVPSRAVGAVLTYTWTDLEAAITDGSTVFVRVRGCNIQGRCGEIVTAANDTAVAALSAALSSQVSLFSAFPFASVTVEEEAEVGAEGRAVQGSAKIVLRQPTFVSVPVASVSAGGSFSMYITWAAFSAPRPGVPVIRYSAILGEGIGSSTLGQCTDLPPTATYCEIQLTADTIPSHGTVVYATVTAFTLAGVATSSLSPPVRVDNTPPEAFTVDVPDTDRYLVPPYQQIRCSWSAIVDMESRVSSIQTALGTMLGVPDRIPWADVPEDAYSSRQATLTMAGGSALAGGVYYCGVRAINSAGLVTEVWSRTVAIIDVTPPSVVAAQVMDGTDPSRDLVWMPPARIFVDPEDSEGTVRVDMSACWSGFNDVETGIEYYEVGLSYSSDGKAAPNIIDFERTYSLTSHTFVAAPIYEEVVVYVHVRAVNMAGLVSQTVVSSGQTLDRTPPSIAQWAMDAAVAALAARDNAVVSGLPPYAWLFSLNPEDADVGTMTREEVVALDNDPLLTVGVPFSQPTSNGDGTSCILSTWPHEEMVLRDRAVPEHILLPTPSPTPSISPSASRTPTPSATPSPQYLLEWGDDDFRPIPSASSTPEPSASAIPSASPSYKEKALAYTGKLYDTPDEYQMDTNSTIVYELGVAVTSECSAGFERASGLGVCLPCSLGYYKSQPGDHACGKCPAGTAADILAQQVVITDISQQSKVVDQSTPGSVSCACIDDSQAFVDSIGCVCKEGHVPAEWWVRQEIVSSYRGAGSASAQRMCVALTGAAYKPVKGDSILTASFCPNGTVPSIDHSTCMCTTEHTMYNDTTHACECRPGTFMAEQGCALCPSGTYKLVSGDLLSLCRPCPWGSVAAPDGRACSPDNATVPGAVMINNSAAGIYSSVGCGPGTTLRAEMGVSVRYGILLMPITGNGTELAEGSICVEPPGLSPPDQTTGVRSLNGTAALEGAIFPRSLFSMTAVLLGIGQQYGQRPYDNRTFAQYILLEQSGTPSAYRVASSTPCKLPVSAWNVYCEPCPAGRFQPFFMPALSFSQAEAVSGECGRCPPLQKGVYFASVRADLFLDWSGVFDDRGGSGIVSYTVAVGTVMGGSQVVPFVTLPSSTTSAHFPQVEVGPGTPMFLTVISTDAAGNMAVFEDSRPVYYDPSAPIAGVALDIDLDQHYIDTMIEQARQQRLQERRVITAAGDFIERNGTTVDAALVSTADADEFNAGLQTETSAGIQETGFVATGIAGQGDGTLFHLVADQEVDGESTAVRRRLTSLATMYELPEADAHVPEGEWGPRWEHARAMFLQGLGPKHGGHGTQGMDKNLHDEFVIAQAELARDESSVFLLPSALGASLRTSSSIASGSVLTKATVSRWQARATTDQRKNAQKRTTASLRSWSTSKIRPRKLQDDANGTASFDGAVLVDERLNVTLHLPQDPSANVNFTCLNGGSQSGDCAMATGFCRAWRGATNSTGPQYSVVALSSIHACAITRTGAARCWGRASAGAVLRDTPLVGSSAGLLSARASFAPSSFQHIAAASNGCACALTESGAINCWGHSSTTVCPGVVGGPVSVIPGTVNATYRHFALARDGSYIAAIPAGAGAGVICLTPASAAVPGCVSASSSSLGSSASQVSSEQDFTCVLLVTGDMRCLSTLYPSANHMRNFTGPYTSITTTDWEVCAVRGGWTAMRGTVACWRVADPSLDTAPASAITAGNVASPSLYDDTESTLFSPSALSYPRRATILQVLGTSNILFNRSVPGAPAITEDRMILAVNEAGFIASLDAAADGGGYCTTSTTAAALCSSRNASSAAVLSIGQLAGTFGLRYGPSSNAMAWATAACAVGCDLRLICWGKDATVSALRAPADLSDPCSLRVPRDIGDVSGLPLAVCSQAEPDAEEQPQAVATVDMCSMAGTWASGLLRIQQSGNSLSVEPAGLPGTAAELSGLALLDGRLTVSVEYNATLTAARTMLGIPSISQWRPGMRVLSMYESVEGGNITLSDGSVGPVMLQRLVMHGVLNEACTQVTWANGRNWTSSMKCAARFIRVYAGAPDSEDNSYRAPYPFSALDYNESAATFNMGAELLALSDVAIYNEQGINVAAQAAHVASSTSLADCPPASSVLSSAGGEAITCDATAVIDSRGSSTAYVSGSAWGPALSGRSGSVVPFLHIDLGHEAWIDTISVTRAVNRSDAAVDMAWGWLMKGVTVVGYSSEDAREELSPTSRRPDGLFSASVTARRAFSLTIRDNAWEWSPSQPTKTWARLTQTCDYDPVPPAPPSPSVSATPTPSMTPSTTTTSSPSGTPTPTRTPSRSFSATPSTTASAPAIGSASPTPSTSPSVSSTPSPSSTPVPLEYSESNVLPLTADQLQALGRDLLGVAATGDEWKKNSSFTTLEGVPDKQWSANTSKLQLAWEPFSDVSSSILSVAYCWGTRPYSCDLTGWTPSKIGGTSQQARLLVDSAVRTDLRIPAGTTVYGTVAAVNNVGLVSMVATDGLTVDDRPPRVDAVLDTGRYFLNPDARPGSGTVMYRPPLDIDCDVEGRGAGASWRDVAGYAGIGRYEWSVGTCPGCEDILPWTDVRTAVAVYNSTLTIPAGTTFYSSVRATGITGLTTVKHSDGVRVLTREQAHERMTCIMPKKGL